MESSGTGTMQMKSQNERLGWSHLAKSKAARAVICIQYLQPLSKAANSYIITKKVQMNHVVRHCTMLPLSTKSCLKSSKLGPILNGQFCHAISKNICLNVLGSKQP